jgi:hypothetical protein
MEVKSLGSPKSLKAVPIGVAFLSERPSDHRRYVGIKAIDDAVITIDLEGPSTAIPQYEIITSANPLVLLLENARFITSRNIGFIHFPSELDYEPGEIYLFGDGVYLVCKTPAGGLGPVLLNIETNKVIQFFNLPDAYASILFSGWELVANSERGPVMLCEFPQPQETGADK